MSSDNILDHDILSEKLNILDKTLLQTSSSKTIPMLEEVMGTLNNKVLFDELNIPILTDIYVDPGLPESHAA